MQLDIPSGGASLSESSLSWNKWVGNNN